MADQNKPNIVFAHGLWADGSCFQARTQRRIGQALGPEVVGREVQTPEALGALQKAEIAKWWPIIKAAGIKAE
jgi:hypothetical protein